MILYYVSKGLIKVSVAIYHPEIVRVSSLSSSMHIEFINCGCKKYIYFTEHNYQYIRRYISKEVIKTQTGALIAFKVAHANSHAGLNRFCRRFYGYIDKSNKGKYSYERPGFISNYPHINLLRGLIIVRLEDAEEVMTFLKAHNAEVFMREVILLHSDVQKLHEKLHHDVQKEDMF